MIDAPLALAFAAGLVATVNPCGFAMLPAYLSYFMGIDEEEQSRAGALRSALLIGAIVSSGFLLVFGLAGILITAGFRVVIDVIPWVAIVVGIAVIGLGIAIWHRLMQAFPSLDSGACAAVGPPCSAPYIMEFGFVTIPYMAMSSFALILALLWANRVNSQRAMATSI